MKVQRLIRIFCYVLLLDFLNGKDLPLNSTENNERLDKCGKFEKQSFSKIISWGQNQGKGGFQTAALISKRHILVPSNIVLEGKNWIGSTEGFDEKICAKKENGHIDVPQEALKSVGFGWNPNITRAIIICNSETFKYVNETWLSFPMIVETIESFDHKPFCLPRRNHRISEILHDFYQYVGNQQRNKEVVYKTELMVRNSTQFPGFVDTDMYKIDTSGLLVDKKTGTLVGLGVNPGGVENNNIGGFLNIVLLADDLCKLFGICENRVNIPPVAPTTPPSKTGKLSNQENELRKFACGFEPDAKVLGYVTNGTTHSMMTMISTRHFLTTANIPLEGTQWDAKKCQGKRRIPVDPSGFNSLKFSWGSSIVIKNAWILCVKTVSSLDDNYVLPMIIEVSPNVYGSKPCLPSDGVPLEPKEPLQVYQYNKSGNYKPTSLTLAGNGNVQTYIYTTVYPLETSKSGNPLFKEAKKKWTIVGVSTGVNGMFFSVQWMLQDLCDLAGTCESESPATVLPPVTKAPATVPPVVVITKKPATVAPPTTEAPSTKKPADPSTLAPAKKPTTETLNFTTSESIAPLGSENSTTIEITDSDIFTTLSTHEPSTLDESTPPEPEPMEPIKTIDVDREFEEFKERERNEVDLDDEWDNDFYRSADFFEKTGKRTELFVGFLMVILMVWSVALG